MKERLKNLEDKTIDLYHEWVHLFLETDDPYAKEVMERMGNVVDKFVEAIDLQRLQNVYSYIETQKPPDPLRKGG